MNLLNTSATEGVDFESLSGSVTFDEGVNSASVFIVPIDDSESEAGEKIKLVLTSVSDPHYTIDPASEEAYTAILDDDSSGGSGGYNVWIEANDPASDEAGEVGEFTIFRDDNVGDLTIDFDVSGLAANQTDYQAIGTSLTLLDGDFSKTIFITPIEDQDNEGDEDVVLTLTAVSDPNYIIGTATDTVWIHDNDGSGGSGGENHAPWAMDDFYSMLHDTIMVEPSPGVTGNDGDNENDPISSTLDAGPANGILSYLNPDGAFEYVPNPGWMGTDTFTYHVNDGLEDSNIATVTIDVTATGDPVAYDDQAWTSVGQSITIYVLNNDSDPNRDGLSVMSVSDPTNVTISPDGSSITYTPDVTFTSGVDTFEYTIEDVNGDTATASVSVTMVEVTDWTLEYKDENGNWFANPDGEVVWADDELRWTATYNPSNPPTAASIEWRSQNWTEFQQGGDNWTIFASAPYDDPAFGNPGVGNWAVTPQIHFDSFPNQTAFVAQMAVPKQAVVARNATLHWVTFENEHEIASDPVPSGPYELYSEKHWSHFIPEIDWTSPEPYPFPYDPTNFDSDPLAYTRGDTMSVSLEIVLDEVWNGGQINVRADGPGDIYIPATVANVNGRLVTLTSIAAENAFTDTIKHYDNFDLNWEISFDGGTTWKDAGTSSNDLYLTLQDPIIPPGSELWHTVIHTGSHNADGENTAAGAVAKIWTEFSDRIVKFAPDSASGTRGDNQLTYWGNPLADAISTKELLADVHGQCGAWAEFLIDCIKAQGITGTNKIEIHNIDQQAGQPLLFGMMVKIWNFAGAGSSPGTAPYVYTVTVPNADATPQDGAPAQGNDNPQSLFYNHYIVKYGNQYYDPSYGNQPYATQADWENASLDGFYVDLPIGRRGKKNDPNIMETRFNIV